jgi:hypothetical protein
LKKKAKYSSETVVMIPDYVASHIREENTLDSAHCENLKSSVGYLRFEVVKAVTIFRRKMLPPSSG